MTNACSRPLLPDCRMLIEPILSRGQATISYADGSRLELRTGDHVLIPRRQRHRVQRTSTEPPCNMACGSWSLDPSFQRTLR